MRPSKDNFWSSDDQLRQPGFHEPNPGSNGELNAIIATMSTGPVGPADGAGQHNATRLHQTCASTGRILQTEKPLTPIDATFSAVLINGSENVRAVPAAAVWGSFSGGTSSVANQFGQLVYHILAVDAEPLFSLLRRDGISQFQPVPPPLHQGANTGSTTRTTRHQRGQTKRFLCATGIVRMRV